MGNIYLLCELGSNPERYKIGITKGDPNKRIKQLQTGCSSEIILLKTFNSKYYNKIESSLHRSYKLYALDGGKEWFQLPSELIFEFEERCNQLHQTFTMLEESGNPFFR